MYNLGGKIDEGFESKNDQHWLQAMVMRLIRDGLLKKIGTKLALPD